MSNVFKAVRILCAPFWVECHSASRLSETFNSVLDYCLKFHISEIDPH